MYNHLIRSSKTIKRNHFDVITFPIQPFFVEFHEFHIKLNRKYKKPETHKI